MDAPQDLLRRIPEDRRQALLDVLAQDPRPGYQHDAARVYGMEFGGLDVRFTVEDGVLRIRGNRAAPLRICAENKAPRSPASAGPSAPCGRINTIYVENPNGERYNKRRALYEFVQKRGMGMDQSKERIRKLMSADVRMARPITSFRAGAASRKMNSTCSTPWTTGARTPSSRSSGTGSCPRPPSTPRSRRWSGKDMRRCSPREGAGTSRSS